MFKYLKTSVLILLFLILKLNDSFAQPGYDCTWDYQEIFRLTLEIIKYPDSTELHEQRLSLNHKCGSFEDGLEDIDYLLNKSPNSKQLLLEKVNLYLRNSYSDSLFSNSTKVFKDYFDAETDPCKIRPLLMRIGDTYLYKNQFDITIEYYNRALSNKCERGYYDDDEILHEKKKAHHSSGQYEEAYEMLKQIDELSLEAIRYNSINIKDFNLSKTNISKRFDKLYTKNKVDSNFVFYGSFPSYLEADILEIAYTEYSLSNSDIALDILFKLTEFDYPHQGISVGEVYPPYWCMYKDLYKAYENDYRIHLITAYNYTKESHGLTSYRHNEITCQPQQIMDLEFLSWNDLKQKINNEALKEIKIAERLTSKKFDLYRAITLREMENDDESISILKKLLSKSPNDIPINYALSYSYLSRSKFNDNLDYDEYNKYKEKVKILKQNQEEPALKIKL